MNAWNYFVDLFARVRTDFVEWLQGFDLPSSLLICPDSLIGILLVLLIVFPFVMLFIWMERRFIARMQIRPGPNRCGPLGLLYPVADAVKILLKELIMPKKGDKIVHWIAPVVLFFAALMVFAVFHIGKGEMGGFTHLNI